MDFRGIVDTSFAQQGGVGLEFFAAAEGGDVGTGLIVRRSGRP
jgi:hypothetical protein